VVVAVVTGEETAKCGGVDVEAADVQADGRNASSAANASRRFSEPLTHEEVTRSIVSADRS
jgi:hypothetical protein